jgi:hypothetical protein
MKASLVCHRQEIEKLKAWQQETTKAILESKKESAMGFEKLKLLEKLMELNKTGEKNDKCTTTHTV